MKKLWNQCDECGRFISYRDFADGKATRREITPSSHVSWEEWETLCRKHSKWESREGKPPSQSSLVADP